MLLRDCVSKVRRVVIIRDRLCWRRIMTGVSYLRVRRINVRVEAKTVTVVFVNDDRVCQFLKVFRETVFVCFYKVFNQKVKLLLVVGVCGTHSGKRVFQVFDTLWVSRHVVFHEKVVADLLVKIIG